MAQIPPVQRAGPPAFRLGAATGPLGRLPASPSGISSVSVRLAGIAAAQRPRAFLLDAVAALPGGNRASPRGWTRFARIAAARRAGARVFRLGSAAALPAGPRASPRGFSFDNSAARSEGIGEAQSAGRRAFCLGAAAAAPPAGSRASSGGVSSLSPPRHLARLQVHGPAFSVVLPSLVGSSSLLQKVSGFAHSVQSARSATTELPSEAPRAFQNLLHPTLINLMLRFEGTQKTQSPSDPEKALINLRFRSEGSQQTQSPPDPVKAPELARGISV
mmetsp:Transcript_24516/g.61221  ORF Transcript_24516/g.61221 Transcript_24516/m.61221 type:complete len:275 (-) Transcript_24516:480-1304(-)